MVPALAIGDALFIDFDGTLTEIAATPDDVIVDARVPRLLVEVAKRLDGALSVVSGRPLAQLARVLHPYVGAMAGVHGLERRNAGGNAITSAPLPELLHARWAMASFAATRPGVALEDKGSALALHYRNGPEHGRACREAARGAARGRLVVVPGKMVVEVHPRGFNKGRAIESFMVEAPFRDRRPVYVGDDRPDEAGFEYVNGVGGESIMVGLSVAPTVARSRFEGVSSVIAWLEDFASGAPFVEARADRAS